MSPNNIERYYKLKYFYMLFSTKYCLWLEIKVLQFCSIMTWTEIENNLLQTCLGKQFMQLAILK